MEVVVPPRGHVLLLTSVLMDTYHSWYLAQLAHFRRVLCPHGYVSQLVSRSSCPFSSFLVSSWIRISVGISLILPIFVMSRVVMDMYRSWYLAHLAHFRRVPCRHGYVSQLVSRSSCTFSSCPVSSWIRITAGISLILPIFVVSCVCN